MTNLSAEDLAVLCSRLSQPDRDRFSAEGASCPSCQVELQAEQAYKHAFYSGMLVGSLSAALLVYCLWAAITGMILPGLPISSLTGGAP